MTDVRTALFSLGQIVRQRDDAFRGVVMDVDARFAGPAGMTATCSPDQPFYKVYAIGEDGGFVAYAAEESLLADSEFEPLSPADQRRWFTVDTQGRHAPLSQAIQ